MRECLSDWVRVCAWVCAVNTRCTIDCRTCGTFAIVADTLSQIHIRSTDWGAKRESSLQFSHAHFNKSRPAWKYVAAHGSPKKINTNIQMRSVCATGSDLRVDVRSVAPNAILWVWGDIKTVLSNCLLSCNGGERFVSLHSLTKRTICQYSFVIGINYDAFMFLGNVGLMLCPSVIITRTFVLLFCF